MIKKILNKKLAVVAFGMSLCMTLVGVTSVCAKTSSVSGDAQNNIGINKNLTNGQNVNGKYQVNIGKVTARHQISNLNKFDKPASAEYNQTLLNAFGKCIIDINQPKISYTFNVQNTKYQNINLRVRSLEAKVIDAQTKKERVVCAKGNGTAYVMDFDINKDIATGVFKVVLEPIDKNASEMSLEFTMEFNMNTLVTYPAGEKVTNGDVQKLVSKYITSDATNKKTDNGLDKSPKTADSMSTGVMVAALASGMSLVALAGFYFVRKKNNIV